MHEYSITINILNIVLAEAQKAGSRKITKINLVIGDLSSIIDNSVQFYFDIVSKGTEAEGAKLVFNRIKSQIKCKQCGLITDRPLNSILCPHCGNEYTMISKGNEFYVEGISVQK